MSTLLLQFQFMYKIEKNSEELIGQANEAEIKLMLINRFKREHESTDFFDILPDSEIWRLLSWWRDIDSVDLQTIVENAVANKVENVIKLIKVFTPTITSFGGTAPRTFKSGFDAKNYASMTEIIDIGFAYEILKASGYIREKYDLSAIPNRDALTDTQLANIFMQFFEKGISDRDSIPAASVPDIESNS